MNEVVGCRRAWCEGNLAEREVRGVAIAFIFSRSHDVMFALYCRSPGPRPARKRRAPCDAERSSFWRVPGWVRMCDASPLSGPSQLPSDSSPASFRIHIPNAIKSRLSPAAKFPLFQTRAPAYR